MESSIDDVCVVVGLYLFPMNSYVLRLRANKQGSKCPPQQWDGLLNYLFQSHTPPTLFGKVPVHEVSSCMLKVSYVIRKSSIWVSSKSQGILPKKQKCSLYSTAYFEETESCCTCWYTDSCLTESTSSLIVH